MKLQILFIIYGLLGLFLASDIRADDSCPLRDIALPELTKLRALQLKKPIPCKKLDKTEIRSFLESALKKKISPEKLETERKVLVALKLIPSDFNYQEELLGLYTDQVGGFYDPEGEYFATASWIPENLQVPIAFHELTHALQDQHYDLDSFTDAKLTTDDLLARSALAEGDASLTMLLVGKSRSDKNLSLKEAEVKFFSINTINSSLNNKKLADTPPAIRAQLVLPYSKGTEYVFKLYKQNSWKAVNEKYRTPPLGMNEILGFKTELLSENEKAELTCEFLTNHKNISYQDTLGALYLGYVLGEDALKTKLEDRWAGDKLCVENTNQELIWAIRLKKGIKKDAVIKVLEEKLKPASVSLNPQGLILVKTSL